MNKKPIYIVGDQDGKLYGRTPHSILARRQADDGGFFDAIPIEIPEAFLDFPIYIGSRIDVRLSKGTVYLWSIDFGDGSRMIDHVEGIQVDWAQTPMRVVLPQLAYHAACDYLIDTFDHDLKALKPEQHVTVSSLAPDHFLQHINDKKDDDPHFDRAIKKQLRLVQNVFYAARSDGIDILVLTTDKP